MARQESVVCLPPQGEAFNPANVRSSQDLPPTVLEKIRQEFPHLVTGEIPNKGGTVVIGKATPREQWHPMVEIIMRNHVAVGT